MCFYVLCKPYSVVLCVLPPWLIPEYPISFDATVKRTVFVISFSDYSLQMYRNATNVYMLTLYPEFIYPF